MTGQETPQSLNEACQRFSRFLRENGYPEQVLWVEDTDVVWHRRKLWVRALPEQTAQGRACRKYEEGVRNGRGVKLYAFSELGKTAIAAVILPKDEDARQRAQMPRGGLMLSAAIKKLSAHRVTNRVTWLILSGLHRTDSPSFWESYLGLS
ncbi:MAG TPA: hypothetical protein VMD99_09410 [Terriglobales bacterium]|nr:hypothetical protein [Terriglobales bacterium]